MPPFRTDDPRTDAAYIAKTAATKTTGDRRSPAYVEAYAAARKEVASAPKTQASAARDEEYAAAYAAARKEVEAEQRADVDLEREESGLSPRDEMLARNRHAADRHVTSQRSDEAAERDRLAKVLTDRARADGYGEGEIARVEMQIRHMDLRSLRLAAAR